MATQKNTAKQYPVLASFLNDGALIYRKTYVLDEVDVDTSYTCNGVTLDEEAALMKEIWAADEEELLVWDEQRLGIGHGKDRLIGFSSDD
jgi:hypothetical protein